MKHILRKVRTALFSGELDFRVRIFNGLACAGMIISLAVGLWGFLLGADWKLFKKLGIDSLT
jgi:hypothetical protein